VNYDSPYNLLQDSKNAFYKLVRKLDKSEAERIKNIAKAHYLETHP
jgi:hypothetical protein